jgi:hypothetical protein
VNELKRLEDTFNSSSSQLHRIGKRNNNTGRPPNKACRYCCRKKVYPEKFNGGSDSKCWRYPSSQECFDCVMVHDGIFDQIRRRRHKSKNEKEKEQQLFFPLTIFDTTKNIMVGEYNTKEKVQNAIDRYQQSSATQKNKNKASKVDMLVVIHYPDYLDFTDCSTNVYS